MVTPVFLRQLLGACVMGVRLSAAIYRPPLGSERSHTRVDEPVAGLGLDPVDEGGALLGIWDLYMPTSCLALGWLDSWYSPSIRGQ